MGFMLKNGERRTLRTPDLTRITGLEVIAYRMDSDTPIVILKSMDNQEMWLDDRSADQLSKAIKTALSYLPSSK